MAIGAGIHPKNVGARGSSAGIDPERRLRARERCSSPEG
jgi:hypothetical protein